MFCRYCGNPSEGPVCPTCAAQAQDAAPAEAVTPEMTPAETNVETPAMELNTEPTPAPKKKSKKKLWLSLVAVVSAVAVAVGAFTLLNPHWFQSPEARLQTITKESLSTYTDALSDVYGLLLKGDSPLAKYNSSTSQISLELNESIAALLATGLQQADIPVSASDLTKLTLSVDSAYEGDVLQLGLSADANGKGLSVRATLDAKNSVAYVGIPALSERYLKLDLKTLLGVDLNNLSLANLFMVNSMGDDLSGTITPPLDISAIQEALPSKDDFNEMLNRYLEVGLEQIIQVEESEETVTVDGHSQSQTVLTANLNESTLLNMGKAMLQEIENDDTIRELLNALSTMAMPIALPSSGLYDLLVAQIPTLVAELDRELADADTSNYLQLKVSVDGDEPMGYRLSLFGDDVQDAEIFSYASVKDGDTVYFNAAFGKALAYQTAYEANADGSVSSPVIQNDVPTLYGHYVEDGDNQKGEIVLPIGGMDFTLAFDCTDTSTTLRFAPPAELINLLLPPELPTNLLSGGLALEIALTYPSDAETGVRVALLVGDTSMMAVSGQSTMSSNATVSLPQNVVDVSDETQMSAWAYEAIGKLPDLLSTLGFSGEDISALLGSLMGNLF